MNMQPKRILNIRRHSSLLLLLIVGGCGVEASTPTYDMPDEQTMIEDSKHMAAVFTRTPQRDGFMSLDLLDDHQYDFIIHRLLKSGKNPQNSPQLFERLEQFRVRGLSQASEGAERTAAARSALTSDWCGQFLTTPMSHTATQSNLDASALVTCFGGADYTYADVTAYETDKDQTYFNTLDYSFGEDYGGSTDFGSVAVHPSLPLNDGKYHYIDSFAISFDDTTGDVQATYSTFTAEAAAPLIELSHPREFNGGSPVRNCLKRGAWVGMGDCDYASVDANGVPGATPFAAIAAVFNVNGQWKGLPTDPNDPADKTWWDLPAPVNSLPNLYLPIKGTFDAGTDANGKDCHIQSYVKDSTRAVMTLKSTGGWCTATDATDGNGLFNNLNYPTKKNVRKAPFDILADFGPDCLQNLQEVRLLVSVSAFTTCLQDTPRRTAYIGYQPNTTIPDLIGSVDFRNSCFAEGTGIRRSDGKIVAVEDIKAGEKVVANESGLLLTVASIARGIEDHPLVRLFDSEGHDLLLTEKHPVVTASGIIPAEQVTERMEIYTEHGTAAIVGVERLPYDGQVYNLSLGTTEELARIQRQDRTMFAGGIRVGDNEMQFEMERQEIASRAKRAVPAAWQTDYQNSEARKAEAGALK